MGRRSRDDKRMLRVVRALADPTRFSLVMALAEVRELTCGELVERVDVRQPTVSHHLKILVEAGWLRVRREGPYAHFSIDPKVVGWFRDSFAHILKE